MIIRALDDNGDWMYGKGANDYLSGNEAIGEDIVTRLRSFLGDCFFDISAGADWFNLLGGKSQLAIELATRVIITNTENVTKVVELSVNLDANRNLAIFYSVETVFPGTIEETLGFLLTEDGFTLTTEAGDKIHV